jgi:protein SCO1/2
MRRILSLLFLLALSLAAASGEVGIEERLNAQAPLDLVLKDEAGRPVALRALLDRPTVLTLNYFRCAGICTPQLTGVAEVLNGTGAEPGKDFQVLTVSFDPRDTWEIAATKRTNYLREIKRPFPPSAWRFLTGDEGSTRALAEAVGFRYTRQGEDYIHPGALIFLSPQGKVTRYMYGVSYLPADFQMAVQEAARGQATPTISKWLSVCFSYDPAGRKYVFSLTRVAAAIVLGGAAAFLVVLIVKARRRRTGEDA